MFEIMTHGPVQGAQKVVQPSINGYKKTKKLNDQICFNFLVKKMSLNLKL